MTTHALLGLLSDALASPGPRPDLARFEALRAGIVAHPDGAVELAAALKARLAATNSPKTRLLALELIEFLACRGPASLVSELNRKSFLQCINGLLADQALDPFVKLKGLSLVQFLKNHFASQAAAFPNFQWYHSTLLARGIKLPPPAPSPYAGPRAGSSIVGGFSERQKKLFADLNVVAENVAVANSMIDEREAAASNEVMFNLKVMEKKLLTLPDKLSHAREAYLYRLALAVIQDIGVTIDRHYRLTSKLSVPKYESKAQRVIKEGTASTAPAEPASQQDPFGTVGSLMSKDNEQPRPNNMELLDLTPPPAQTPAPMPVPHAPVNNYAISTTEDMYNLDLGGMSKPATPAPGWGQDHFAMTLTDQHLHPMMVQATSFVKQDPPAALPSDGGVTFHNPATEALKNPPKAPEYDPFSHIEPTTILTPNKVNDIDFF